MQCKGLKHTIVNYTTLLGGLGKVGRAQSVQELFEEMMGKGISPDVVTYTSIIHGLCVSGFFKEATWFLNDMLNRGIPPNVRTYSSRFTVRCFSMLKEGSRHETELNQLLHEWSQLGYKVIGSVCNVSVRAQRDKLMEETSSVFNGKLNILDNPCTKKLLKLEGKDMTSSAHSADSSTKTGCFDLICSGFVQTSLEIVLCASIDTVLS
ncbi:hypothetical protein IFM89_007212 [Coptis chinensis]|uniref:Neprosin PEP catalytic domain-containing protein n=1 Tax=Coptis chinensis TaxID=261450 RepID=A0A835LD33_9MAGN|nr:hypothetical protein IFM89_007212 [Coptis chinensis]